MVEDVQKLLLAISYLSLTIVTISAWWLIFAHDERHIRKVMLCVLAALASCRIVTIGLAMNVIGVHL